MGLKTTRRQRENRRREVYALVVSGQWNPATRRELASKHKLTEWTLWQDHRWIMERVRRPADLPPSEDDERAEFLLRIRETIRKAEEDGKYGAVASLLAVEAKVLGLAQPTKIDVRHSGGVAHAHVHVSAMSDEDLRERLEDLRKRTPALPLPPVGTLPASPLNAPSPRTPTVVDVSVVTDPENS